MYELLTGVSPFTVDGDKNTQQVLSTYFQLFFYRIILNIISIHFFLINVQTAKDIGFFFLRIFLGES